MNQTIREGYRQSGLFLEQVVGGVTKDSFEGPGLGEWTVRELIGHSTRGLVTVEQYLAAPAKAINLQSAVAYYGSAASSAIPPSSPLHAQILQRARDAAKELGDEPAKAIAVMRKRVQALVEKTPDDAPMTVIGGRGMRLIDYLPSRCLELVVHSLDIAKATGQSVQAPPIALQVCLHLMADVAQAHNKGEMLLLALTGRESLPQGWV